MLKKELEGKIVYLEETIKQERALRGLLEKELKLLREYFPQTPTHVMTIALEKITEAMSHTIQSLNSRR